MLKYFRRRINTYHKITVKTDQDFTNATVTLIYYTKPDGSQGTWNASLKDGWILFYSAGKLGDVWEIDQEGEWNFEVYVEMGEVVWRSGFQLVFYPTLHDA